MRCVFVATKCNALWNFSIQQLVSHSKMVLRGVGLKDAISVFAWLARVNGGVCVGQEDAVG